MEEDKIVLDDDDHIFGEYQRYLSWDEQRIGYFFIKWVHNYRHDPEKREEVHISPSPHDPGNFLEFPADPDLAAFDLDDRKFVAAARVHPDSPAILNAVDTDWWIFRAALERNDVRVEFLCPQDVEGFARTRHLNK